MEDLKSKIETLHIEKAKELIKKFKPYSFGNILNKTESFGGQLTENAKQCAIIAVNEVIDNIKATMLYHKNSKALPFNMEYWQLVLEALKEI